MTLKIENPSDDGELFRRFALFGISHNKTYLNMQASRIEEICNIDNKVIMLELAPNYETLVNQGLMKPNGYMALAERWKGRCSKLIAGDQEITLPENPDWLLALVAGESYFYPEWDRENIMVRNIVTEKPDIVIVANGNSDWIKDHFPHAYYTVFEVSRGYSASSTGHGGGIHQWHDPDKIIILPSR